MLTTEQSIEVATKLWRWKPKEMHQCEVETAETFQTFKVAPYEEWIKEHVSSWQGFGRTWRAMKERGLLLQQDRGVTRWVCWDDADCHDLKHFGEFYWDDLPSPVTEEIYISATHLSALEALKDG